MANMMSKGSISSMQQIVGMTAENETVPKEAQVQYVKFTFIEEGASPIFAIFEDKEDC